MLGWATLADVPDLACTLGADPPSEGQPPLAELHLRYRGLATDASIDAWLGATLQISDQLSSLEAMRKEASTVPLLGQLNASESHPVQLSVALHANDTTAKKGRARPKKAFFLRSNHIVLDGPGSLSILDRFFDKLASSKTDASAVRQVIKQMSKHSTVLPFLHTHALDVVNLSRKDYEAATLDREVGRRLMEVSIC